MSTRVSGLALATVFAVLGGSAMACPTFQFVGNEAFDVTGNLERTGFPVVAGGDNNTQFCSGIFPVNAPSIYGFFISPPDFSFFLEGAPQAQVRIFTSSPDPSCDTVLLANTPTADWYFNDDSAQLQSEIVMTGVPEGRLDVWVGTFDGSFCQTDLVVEVMSASGSVGDGAKPSGVEDAEPVTATEAEAPATEDTAPAAVEETVEEAPATVDAPLPGGATADEASESESAEAEAEAETEAAPEADAEAAPVLSK